MGSPFCHIASSVEEESTVYTQASLDCVRKRANRALAIAIGMAVIGLAVAGTARVVRNRALGLAGLIAFSILAYGYYALFARPRIVYGRFVSSLLTGLTHEGEGWFEGIDKAVRTSEEGVQVRGVTLLESKANKREALYYWDDHFSFPDIEPGRKLRVVAFGRYIRDLSICDDDNKMNH